MTGEATEEEARESAADERDVLGDARDVLGDEREAEADVRELIADVREAELDTWERQFEGRAKRLGFLREGTPTGADLESERERTARAEEREQATLVRNEAAHRRLAQRRDTVLAAAFAGIAQHLYEAKTPEDLLARIAEAALATVAGSTRATVQLSGGHDRTGADAQQSSADQPDPSVLYFPFTTDAGEGADSMTASLSVYADNPGGLDDAAQDIGFILAAHASLAARAVGDRIRLESLSQRLEDALSSRDVIGQAKGILMERLQTTPEGAFDILRHTSQRLNIKLREIAQTLAETGRLVPQDPKHP